MNYDLSNIESIKPNNLNTGLVNGSNAYQGNQNPVNLNVNAQTETYSFDGNPSNQFFNGPAITNNAYANIGASSEQAEWNRWYRVQNTQSKTFEIQETVAAEQAMNDNKMFGKWDEFITSPDNPNSNVSRSPEVQPETNNNTGATLGAPLSFDSIYNKDRSTSLENAAQQEEMERWKVIEDTQAKVAEIQRDITINQAKNEDKMYGKWDDYFRN